MDIHTPRTSKCCNVLDVMRICEIPDSQAQSVFDAFIMSCNCPPYRHNPKAWTHYGCKGTNLFRIEQMKIAFGAIFGHTSWESIKVSHSRSAYLSALHNLISFGKVPCNRRLTVGQPSGDCRERQGNGRVWLTLIKTEKRFSENPKEEAKTIFFCKK